MLRSTSASRRAPGSAARARTQTGCSGSTCPRSATSQSTVSKTSLGSRLNSTADPARPWPTELRLVHWHRPLRSPVEFTRDFFSELLYRTRQVDPNKGLVANDPSLVPGTNHIHITGSYFLHSAVIVNY